LVQVDEPAMSIFLILDNQTLLLDNQTSDNRQESVTEVTELDKKHCQEISATPSKHGAKGRNELKNLDCSPDFEGSSRNKERGLCQCYEVSGCVVGCFLVVVVGRKGKSGDLVVGVVLSFYEFVLSFCFLFLGVLFVYFMCT
jgi:hypothetical protein